MPAGTREEFEACAGALFQGIVTGHAHVTAEGQRAEAVIGVTTLHAKNARAEAERKHVHAHAAKLGGHEVSPFVDKNHDAQDDGDGDEIN